MFQDTERPSPGADRAPSPEEPGAGGVSGLLHSAYRRLTGQHPDEGARKFIYNLSWIGLSFALAKVTSALVNIAAGRLLGPVEYGRINVMVSAGAAILPFIIAGLNNSVIRYGVAPGDRSGVFTAAGAILFSLASVTGLVLLLFSSAVCAFLGVTPQMLLLAFLYALASALFLLAAGLLQASGEFSKRGLSEIGFSAVLAAAFFLGIYGSGRRYEAMAYAYIAAFGGIGLFWLLSYARKLKPCFPEKEKLGAFLQYSAYSFGGGLGYYLTMNVQGLILNSFLAPREVGIYAAYNTATIGIAGYFGYALGTVLFQKASASTNRKRLWEMTVRSWAWLAPLSLLVFLAAEAGVLSLMGRHQYGLQPRLMLLFALCGTLLMIYSSMAQIIFSQGVKASRLSLFMSWGGGLANFAACLLLIPFFQVEGAAIAFILTYGLQLAWFWKVRDAYL